MISTFPQGSSLPVPRIGTPEWAELVEGALERHVAERTAVLRAHYEQEHLLAQMLQHALLLSSGPASFPGLTVDIASKVALPDSLVGGDFCDAFPIGEENVALVLGDVCGKGIVAALRIPEIKYALRAFLSESPSPTRALTCLNNWLCISQRGKADSDCRFATMALVVLNSRTGLGVCSLAGAEPPLLLGESGDSDSLSGSGMALGVDEGQVYEGEAFHLGSGDLLLMVTDGITEAKHDKALLGYAGMTSLAMQVWAAAKCPQATQVAQAMLAGALRFAGGSLHDDSSVLTAERRRD